VSLRCAAAQQQQEQEQEQEDADNKSDDPSIRQLDVPVTSQSITCLIKSIFQYAGFHRNFIGGKFW